MQYSKTDIPEVGKLLALYYPGNTKKFVSLHLFFIDEIPAPQHPQSWPYTEIALVDEFDEGKGLQVYTEIEAGMIPSNIGIKDAEDEDISKIVETKLEVEGDLGITNLAKWINNINAEQDCASLLTSEKKRLLQITEEVILKNNGQAGLEQYKSLLELSTKTEN